MQKVSSLKRRAEESTEDELDCTRLCKARLDHLKSYASGIVSYPDPPTKKKSRKGLDKRA